MERSTGPGLVIGAHTHVNTPLRFWMHLPNRNKISVFDACLLLYFCVVVWFLVSLKKVMETQKSELPDIAEKTERLTVPVGCWE